MKGAVFDKEYNFNSSEIEPMVTFGTNPGMGISISGKIPNVEFKKRKFFIILKIP